MKKIIILILLLLSGCQVKEIQIDATIKDMQQYQNIKEDCDVFLEIDEEELYQIIEAKNNALIYLSNEKCQTCQKTTSILATLLEEEESFVYYLDAYKIEEDYLKEFLKKALDEKGLSKIHIPILFSIEKGRLKDYEIASHDHIEQTYRKIIKNAK